jgi:Mg2+-importing ATPase
MELNNEYIKLAKLSKEELLEQEKTNTSGLKNNEAAIRLEKNGLNIVAKKENKSRIKFLIESFNDKFIFILIILAIINYFLSDALGSYIIIGIAIVSALIKYFQNYSVYKFNKKLKSELFSTAEVVREGKIKEINIEQLVVGDIVKLNAGTLIPADLILLETKDLFVNQSTFTGENIPVEKTTLYNNSEELFNISNICYMGSSVTSGTGTGLIIKTGFDTYLGNMSSSLNKTK